MKKNALDRLGITLSILCTAHCIGGQFLVLLSPWLGGFFGSEKLHLIMVAVISALALFVFGRTLKRHKNTQPLILGTIGIVCLVAGT